MPSFIVTLGTFFVLIGAKLGFTKLFAGQVTVEGLDESQGYGFWRGLFAEDWIRNSHVWGGRDKLWAVPLVAAFILVVGGVMEMSYTRRSALHPKGLLTLLFGAAIALAGFVGLLSSDGIGANAGFGALTGVGLVVAMTGFGQWRYEPGVRDRTIVIEGNAARSLGGGVAAIVLGSVLTAVFDAKSDKPVDFFFGSGFSRTLFVLGIGVAGVLALLVAAGKLPMLAPLAGIGISALPAIGFLMTRQAARSVVFVVLVVGGIIALLLAEGHAAKRGKLGALVVSAITTAAVVGVAFFIRSQSSSEKFRSRLFTVLLLIALLLLASAILSYLFRARSAADPIADRLGKRVASRRPPRPRGGHVRQDAVLDPARGRHASGRDPLPGLDPLVPAVCRVRHVAAEPHPLRQLDLRGGRQQGGGPSRRSIPRARTKTTLFMIVSGAGVVERDDRCLPAQLGAGQRR